MIPPLEKTNMANYKMMGLSAADIAVTFLLKAVAEHRDTYSPLRSISTHLNVAGFETLYVRAFPAAAIPRLVISSLSIPEANSNKGVFTAFHDRLMQRAQGFQAFIIEYENVTSARLLNYLYRTSNFAFLGGRLREFERDRLTRSYIGEAARIESQDDGCMLITSPCVVIPVSFYHWIVYATAAAASTPRVPLNPLYYDHVTNDVEDCERWGGDYPCTITTVTAGGLAALNLIVRGAPDNLDLDELKDWLTRYPFTYHDHAFAAPQRYDLTLAKSRDALTKLFVTVYEKTSDRVHQVTVSIKQQ